MEEGRNNPFDRDENIGANITPYMRMKQVHGFSQLF